MSNVVYLTQPKDQPTQKQIELAFKVIYRAMQTRKEQLIPLSLHHLTDNQWMMLEEALWELLEEQEESAVH
jgi:uncharacterized protein YrzB (UPF0473 family)